MVLPLEHQGPGRLFVHSTQLRLERHVPINAMHQVSQRHTIKPGRVAYCWRKRVGDAKGGSVFCVCTRRFEGLWV